MSSGLVLHHLEASRSTRVIWLLESFGVTYQLKNYPRDAETKLATNEPFSGKGLAAIHPTGRAPLLQDGNLTLAETGTIFRHILEHYDGAKLYPRLSEKTQEAIDQNFWIDFAEASVMLHMVPLNYLIKGKANTKDGSSIQEKAIARGIRNDFAFIEQALKQNGGILSGSKELGPGDVSESVLDMRRCKVSHHCLPISTPFKFANIYGVEFYLLLTSIQTQEWRDTLGLNAGSETLKWIEKCRGDAKYKIACSKERDGKVIPEHFLDFFVGK